ncbi:MAG: hypothetical protein LUO94_11435 [Methylococcaceae bacterium]|nr:hypothetical protein [Methylococcaceae bacterium]
MMTPYDKLKSIENVKNYLKPDITFEVLDKVALSQNDYQMAEQLQKERSKLFKTINERDLKSCRVVGIYFSPFSDSFIYWKNTGYLQRRCV